VGSVQDTSLLMGFLLMRLAEEIERNPRKLNSPHITVVEEAHRLMAEVGLGGGDSRSSAGEDFANILAEVRGFGEGLIIAEQMPTMLVKGAIGNTFLKIMHWLEDAPSFDLFSSIMNLDPKQREYARTLSTGFAVVRSPSGHPVHIKIPELNDQTSREQIPETSKSDETTKVFMETQRKRLNIEDKEIVPWNASLAARSNGDSARGAKPQADTASNVWGVNSESLGIIMMSPMKTCLYCLPWKTKKQCPYANSIKNLLEENSQIKASIEAWLDKAFDEHSKQKSIGKNTTENTLPLLVEITKAVQAAKLSPIPGTVYCICANIVDDWQHKYPLNDVSRRTVGQRFLGSVNSTCAKINSQKA
jgi:hypothetical protein